MKPRAVTEPAARVLNPHDVPEDAYLWWRDRLDGPLFVYFIQDGDDGPVKIGQAFHPQARLGDLQCGNPRPLNLRAVVLAAEDTEALLHRSWMHALIRGEWFAEDEEIIGRAQRTQRRQIERAEQAGKNLQPIAYAVARMALDISAPKVAA
jgi:hypothetical protein